MIAEAWRARFIPETREVAVGDTQGRLLILDLEGKRQESYDIAEDHITAITTGTRPHHLLVGTLLQGVYWVDRTTKTVRRLNDWSIEAVFDIAVAPSRDIISVVGSHIVVGDLFQKGSKPREVLPQVPNPSSVVFSPDSALMVVGGGEGGDENAHLCVYETTDWNLLRKICFVDAICIDRLAFDVEGHLLAAGGYQECFLLDVRSQFALRASFGVSSFVSALRFSKDGRWLLIGDESGELVVCSTGTGRVYYRERLEGIIPDIEFMDGYFYVAYGAKASADGKDNFFIVKRILLPI